MKLPISVDQALKKLEDETKDLPPPEMPPIDPILQIQNTIISIRYAQEAIIDILLAYGIINENIFSIAFSNVVEFANMKGDTMDILKHRAEVLKKKLGDYSKTRKANPRLKSKTKEAKKKHG